MGYGRRSFEPASKGHLCLWSMKNPASPLLALPMHAAVTALDWSRNSGSLLAVGFSDGTLALYDVRTQKVC